MVVRALAVLCLLGLCAVASAPLAAADHVCTGGPHERPPTCFPSATAEAKVCGILGRFGLDVELLGC